MRRTAVQRTAQMCSGNFGKVCKALWPDKTAEELAARAGYKSVRTAHYEISGEREPSARAIAVVIAAILPAQ
jgi:hypothetical protein